MLPKTFKDVCDEWELYNDPTGSLSPIWGDLLREFTLDGEEDVWYTAGYINGYFGHRRHWGGSEERRAIWEYGYDDGKSERENL